MAGRGWLTFGSRDHREVMSFSTPFEWIIFAECVAFKLRGAKDSLQIGVASEVNAKQVINFPLRPVCRFPVTVHGGQCGCWIIHKSFDDEPLSSSGIHQDIDHAITICGPGVFQVITACDITEHVEPQMMFEVRHEIVELSSRDDQASVVSERFRFQETAQVLIECCEVHRNLPFSMTTFRVTVEIHLDLKRQYLIQFQINATGS